MSNLLPAFTDELTKTANLRRQAMFMADSAMLGGLPGAIAGTAVAGEDNRLKGALAGLVGGTLGTRFGMVPTGSIAAAMRVPPSVEMPVLFAPSVVGGAAGGGLVRALSKESADMMGGAIMEQPAMGTGKGMKKRPMKKQAFTATELVVALSALGAPIGAVTGAIKADKGERWKGAKKGALVGAGTGAAVGAGILGGLKLDDVLAARNLRKADEARRAYTASRPPVRRLMAKSAEEEPNVQDVLSEMMAQSQYHPEPEQPFWGEPQAEDPYAAPPEMYGHGTGLKNAPPPKKAKPPVKAKPQPQPTQLPKREPPPGPQPVPVRKEKLRVASVDKTAAIAARFFGNFGK